MLPSSLYLSSVPSFFSGYTWPWVVPENATTQLYTLPAKARFEAGNAVYAALSGTNVRNDVWDGERFLRLYAEAHSVTGVVAYVSMQPVDAPAATLPENLTPRK